MAAGIATRARNNKANAINSQNTLKIGTEEGEVAVLTGQVRRVLSLEGVKGSARVCLTASEVLERVPQQRQGGGPGRKQRSRG